MVFCSFAFLVVFAVSALLLRFVLVASVVMRVFWLFCETCVGVVALFDGFDFYIWFI